MAGFPAGKGIENYGNFVGGLCFKLNQTHPIAQTLIICSPDMVNYKLKNLFYF